MLNPYLVNPVKQVSENNTSKVLIFCILPYDALETNDAPCLGRVVHFMHLAHWMASPFAVGKVELHNGSPIFP